MGIVKDNIYISIAFTLMPFNSFDIPSIFGQRVAFSLYNPTMKLKQRKCEYTADENDGSSLYLLNLDDKFFYFFKIFLEAS